MPQAKVAAGVALVVGTFGTLGGATALSHKANYHASMIIVSVMAVIDLIITQFLKPPRVFRAADEVHRTRNGKNE